MGRKNHQPLDKSRRRNLSQFKGLGGVTVNKTELAPASPSGLLALAQHRLGESEAVHADRDAAIDRDLREHRADLVRRQPVAQRAAHMGLEFLHLAERGYHAEVEDRALARAERVVAPGFAPAILRDDALEVAVEIVRALERAIDIFFAEHLAAHGETAVVHFLVHGQSSVGCPDAGSAASRVSIAGLGNALPPIAS